MEGNRPDWFDDFMIMKMMEEDASFDGDPAGGRPTKGGYLPIIITAIVLYLVAKLIA